jgi:hypothetical protein
MLSHAQARRIASEWHGGSHSPLYAFVSTGRITDNTLEEVAGCLIDTEYRLGDERDTTGGEYIETQQQQTDLWALNLYLRHHNDPETPFAAPGQVWHRLWSNEPVTLEDV